MHRSIRPLENLLETELIGLPLNSVDSADAPTTLTQQVATIVAAIESWLQEHPAMRFLLIIDQLEEVVTMCRQQEEREQFVHDPPRADTDCLHSAL